MEDEELEDVEWRELVQSYLPLIIKTVKKEVGEIEDIDVSEVISDVVIRCLEYEDYLTHSVNPVIHKVYLEKVAQTVTTTHIRNYLRRRELSKLDEMQEGLKVVSGDTHRLHPEDTEMYKRILDTVAENGMSKLFYMWFEKNMHIDEMCYNVGKNRRAVYRDIQKVKDMIKQEVIGK